MWIPPQKYTCTFVEGSHIRERAYAVKHLQLYTEALYEIHEQVFSLL